MLQWLPLVAGKRRVGRGLSYAPPRSDDRRHNQHLSGVQHLRVTRLMWNTGRWEVGQWGRVSNTSLASCPPEDEELITAANLSERRIGVCFHTWQGLLGKNNSYDLPACLLKRADTLEEDNKTSGGTLVPCIPPSIASQL